MIHIMIHMARNLGTLSTQFGIMILTDCIFNSCGLFSRVPCIMSWGRGGRGEGGEHQTYGSLHYKFLLLSLFPFLQLHGYLLP